MNRSNFRRSIANVPPKNQSQNGHSKDAMLESNISVYVRCRSRTEREIKENSEVVVSTKGHMGKQVTLETGPTETNYKTYTFDRVFGAESDQETVFDGIAENTLNEMLEGYNCTIFAYGQTGTGKTYTMSGDSFLDDDDKVNDNSGIISRTLEQLFRILEEKTEFLVKISFIELYNEELRDLLATEKG